MTYEDFKILAVIPARGGSKGIPRKNLCQIAGISLVGHAAEVAKSLEKEKILVLAQEIPKVINHLTDKKIVKTIFVPGRLINFVVK